MSRRKSGMHLLKWSLVGFATFLSSSMAGATGYVLGDSIGEGVAVASGLKGLARISVHIRGNKALAQINQTPAGSIVFIVLGTNDADGSIKNLEKSIDAIVAAAARKRLTMIWMGPHCVRRSWDVRSRELDEILRTRLAKTSVKYVSMRDARLCSGAFHEPDGVHLKMSGYRYMWEKARGSVGFSASGPQFASAAGRQANVADSTGSVSPTESPNAPIGKNRAPATGSEPRIIMEIHVPPAGPSGSLVWTRVEQ
jgi:hypothetical protein